MRPGNNNFEIENTRVVQSALPDGAATEATLGRVALALEASGSSASSALTNRELRSAPVKVSGPLTDRELRASPVDVVGPLTDTELRASAVPVSGPLTDTELRAEPVVVATTDSAGNDAFGRMRVSNQTTLLEVKRVGNTPNYLYSTSVSGSGAVTYTTNRCSTYLTVGAAAGTAILQSKSRAVYQPGKSLLLFQTFIAAPQQTNLRQRLGYFDANNGIFLQMDGAEVSLIRRTYVGGSPDDTAKVLQAAWNLDPMDGSGPSGVTLNWTKPQILFADFEWLGVGRVRVGFVVDGKPHYVHEFLNTNSTISSVYMANPNLPIRWELEATDTVTGTPSLEAICASVNSEGGYDLGGMSVAADSGTSANAIASGAMEELLAIRMQSAYTEFAAVVPEQITVINTTSGPFRWRLVLNPTETGAGTWSNVTGSVVEQNTTRTVTADTGTVMAAGFVSATNNAVELHLGRLFQLGTTLAGVTDVLSLQIHNLSVSSENYYGSVSWHEVY